MAIKASSNPIGPVTLNLDDIQRFGHHKLQGYLDYTNPPHHVGRSFFLLHCKHCSLSYRLKLTDNPDEQWETFLTYHSACIAPTIPGYLGD